MRYYEGHALFTVLHKPLQLEKKFHKICGHQKSIWPPLATLNEFTYGIYNIYLRTNISDLFNVSTFE